MIDSLVNLIFRCAHRRLTNPVTPVGKDDRSPGETYVVCLDCGKHFGYDLKRMKIGKPLENSSPAGIMPPGMPTPRVSKLKLAVMAAVPLGIAVGSIVNSKRRRHVPSPSDGQEPASPTKKPS